MYLIYALLLLLPCVLLVLQVHQRSEKFECRRKCNCCTEDRKNRNRFYSCTSKISDMDNFYFIYAPILSKPMLIQTISPSSYCASSQKTAFIYDSNRNNRHRYKMSMDSLQRFRVYNFHVSLHHLSARWI